MGQSKVTLDGASKVKKTEAMDSRDQSGPKDTPNQSVGPQFPWICHPRLPWMLVSEVNIFEVQPSDEIGEGSIIESETTTNKIDLEITTHPFLRTFTQERYKTKDWV